MDILSLNKYFGIIGIGIFIFILSKTNLKEVYSTIKNLDYFLLTISFLLLLIVTLIISLRWRYIVNKTGISLSIKDSIFISFKSLFSEYSPGKTGYLLVTSVYLKNKTKEDWGKIIFSTTFNKFMDVWITAIEALIGFIILFWIFGIKSSVIIPIIVILAIIVLSFIFFINYRLMKCALKLFFKLFIPKKYQENFENKFASFYDNIHKINHKIILISLFYQIITLIIAGLFFYFLGMAMGIHIPLYVAIILEPIVAIASILPISFSGLGTREAGIAFLFSLINISLEYAIIFSLITFLFRNLLILIGLMIIPLEKYFEDDIS